jgi:uncharacterized protein (TIGR03067 family)
MKRIQLQAVLLLSLIVAVGCQSQATRQRAKEEAIKEPRQDIDGTWVLMSSEVDGKNALDIGANTEGEATLVLQHGKGSVRSAGEEVAEFSYNVDPSKRPKTLDLTLVKGIGFYKPFEGSNSLAIFELNKDTLKTCFTLFAVQRERPAEFVTKPKSGLLLEVWKRAKG